MKRIIFLVTVFIVISQSVLAVGDVDPSVLDEVMKDDSFTSFFGSMGEIIDKILNNDLHLDGKSVLDNILSLFFSSLKEVLPSLGGIMGVTVILSLMERLELLSGKAQECMLACGRVIFCVMLINASASLITEAKSCIGSVSKLVDGVMPVMVTLLASVGAQGSVATLAPSQMLLSGVLLKVLTALIFPLISAGTVIITVDGAVAGGRLKGIGELIKSIATTVTGGIIGIFSFIIALQGIVAGFTDGISVKSIRYALSSSVPVIGSGISDSFSMILLSGSYIKGALGAGALITLTGIILVPVINIFAFVFILRCFCAVSGAFAGSFVLEQTKRFIEFIRLVGVILLAVNVIWFIFLGILTLAGGYV